MSPPQIWSLLVFVGVPLFAAALIIAYDAWVGTTYGADATISGTMHMIGHRYPMVPYIYCVLTVGISAGLAGHFWGGWGR